MTEFYGFGRIPRLMRSCIVTEKIDGTNAQIYIGEDGEIRAGSRKRWITPDNDNFGFAAWVEDNKDELLKLGPGRHFGEWWGNGIQRNYGMDRKVFSLFNVSKWSEERPSCCEVVPVLWQGMFCTESIKSVLEDLAKNGSRAAPGFMEPEGVIVFHEKANFMFKYTVDDRHKEEV